MSTAQLKAAATGGAVAKPTTFPAMIEQLKKQVALAVPKHLNADRMARIALTEFNKNSALAECDPRSVFASVIIASQLGLEPGITGQGYLVPYAGKCQFIPGWQGLVDLAQRSGRSSVWTGAVFEGDEFDYNFGSDPKIHHKPCGEDNPDLLRYVYAVGRVRGAEYPIIDVWTAERVFRHRDRFNKVGKKHYSYNHPVMYARKIPLLQVLKYMPKSIELHTAMELDHAGNDGGQRLDIGEALQGNYTVVEEPQQGQEPAAQAQPKTIIAGDIPATPDAQAWIDTFRGISVKAELTEAWKECVSQHKVVNLAVPLAVEATYNERRELLA